MRILDSLRWDHKKLKYEKCLWNGDRFMGFFGSPGKAIKDHPVRVNEIEKEFRVQIELALRKIPRLSHISGHMGCTNLNDEVKAMTERLAKEYKIDIDLSALGVLPAGTKVPTRRCTKKLTALSECWINLKKGRPISSRTGFSGTACYPSRRL